MISNYIVQFCLCGPQNKLESNHWYKWRNIFTTDKFDTDRKNHCCYFLVGLISRDFCLLLETYKSLFSEDTEFRILVNDVDEYNKYDTRTAYRGTVEGKWKVWTTSSLSNAPTNYAPTESGLFAILALEFKHILLQISCRSSLSGWRHLAI